MSPADKNNIMKTTIKIDYERTNRLAPVIKIIIPKLACLSEATQMLPPGFNEPIDDDIKDKLTRDFLQLPSSAIPNSFFEVKTHFPIKDDLELTTIGPIEEENLFSRFRWALLHRFVPASSISILCSTKVDNVGQNGNRKAEFGEENWHKINDFFDWLEKQPYSGNTFDESDKLPKMTLRELFETRLSQEERINAFNNTERRLWDVEVSEPYAYSMLYNAFDWKSSPEGVEYWTEVAKKLNN